MYLNCQITDTQSFTTQRANYCSHKSKPLVSCLSYFNPVNPLNSYFEINFIIIPFFYVCGSQVVSSLQTFGPKLHIDSTLPKCPTQSELIHVMSFQWYLL
jgi:hypothetical protein